MSRPAIYDKQANNPAERNQDFVLRDGVTSVWLEVDDISLWIRRLPDGAVLVEAYPKGDEMADEIASMFVECNTEAAT